MKTTTRATPIAAKGLCLAVWRNEMAAVVIPSYYKKDGVEESEEAVFWLELLTDTGAVSAEKLSLLLKEANELFG
jgi:hypothetical protein